MPKSRPKRPALLAELLRIFRERDPERDLKLMARTWGVAENTLRNWEDQNHDGAVPYHELLKYRDFYAAPPGIALALAEMAELALAGNRQHLEVYAMLMKALAGRVLRSNGAGSLMELKYTPKEKPAAVLVAFIDAVHNADPRRRRDVFKDQVMIGRYLRHAEEEAEDEAKRKEEAKRREEREKASDGENAKRKGRRPRRVYARRRTPTLTSR